MELIYKQYSKAMFNICLRMMGNTHDAEDVLQDAFVKAFGHLHQLKEFTQFGGWLKRIVINECIKQSKKKGGFSELSTTDVNALSETDYSTWWHNVDLAMIHGQIKSLPDGCRQIFTLFSIENYSHKTIALELDISESTSKSQYHRAKMLLRSRLTKILQQNGSI